MRSLGSRSQRTLAQNATVTGIGYITGKTVKLTFLPAPANSGIVFARTDLGACVSARVANVVATDRRTTLADGPAQVTLVEHVLSALAGMHVDNCVVELDAPEPPGMDGSADAFVQALRSARIIVQREKRPIFSVAEPVSVSAGDATISFHPTPAQQLKISYVLNYGMASAIVPQMATEIIDPENYTRQISRCRTFLLEEEALYLQKQGLGSKSEVSDLLVFGPHGPIRNRLRFGNEPARHKILDIVGDLSLLGVDLCGHIVAYRSGHPHNFELAKKLHAAMRKTPAKMQMASGGR